MIERIETPTYTQEICTFLRVTMAELESISRLFVEPIGAQESIDDLTPDVRSWADSLAKWNVEDALKNETAQATLQALMPLVIDDADALSIEIDTARMFMLGVTALYACMQNEYLGPRLQTRLSDIAECSRDGKYWRQRLVMDGEEVIEAIDAPEWLSLARFIFDRLPTDCAVRH